MQVYKFGGMWDWVLYGTTKDLRSKPALPYISQQVVREWTLGYAGRNQRLTRWCVARILAFYNWFLEIIPKRKKLKNIVSYVEATGHLKL